MQAVIKLIDKYVIGGIAICAVVMAVLIGMLGPGKGIAAGGKATDLTGTSIGAVIGYIPRWFNAIGKGQDMASGENKSEPSSSKKSGGKKASDAPARQGS